MIKASSSFGSSSRTLNSHIMHFIQRVHSRGYIRAVPITITKNISDAYPRQVLKYTYSTDTGDNVQPYSTTKTYSTVQYSTVQYSTVQYSTVLSVQYSTVQYSTVQYSTVQYSTVQYSTVQYSTVQYSTVQYSTIQ